MIIKTQDGKTFLPADCRCVGSVPKVRCRGVNDTPIIGQFPVFVEQSGSYRMFTYNRKITEVIAS